MWLPDLCQSRCCKKRPQQEEASSLVVRIVPLLDTNPSSGLRHLLTFCHLCSNKTSIPPPTASADVANLVAASASISDQLPLLQVVIPVAAAIGYVYARLAAYNWSSLHGRSCQRGAVTHTCADDHKDEQACASNLRHLLQPCTSCVACKKCVQPCGCCPCMVPLQAPRVPVHPVRSAGEFMQSWRITSKLLKFTTQMHPSWGTHACDPLSKQPFVSTRVHA